MEEALPLDDHDAQPLQDVPLSGLRVVAAQAADLLGSGAGSLLVELGVGRSDIPSPLTASDLSASTAFGDVLAGRRTVGRGAGDRALVKLLQRALQAVGARSEGAPTQLRLPAWGADGGFGEESQRATSALQRWRGLAETGIVGAGEARELQLLISVAPPPDLFDAGHPVKLLSRGARRVVDIAERICDATRDAPFTMRVDGVRYSYYARQFGVARTGGLLRIPGGVAYDVGSSDYWKCNVFGGTVLSLAELPVPTFQAGRYRHFPRAERFGDALKLKNGWRLVKYLDHRDPADPTTARTGPAQDAEIKALLGQAQAGDVFFVDHPGQPGDDGGHTRICTRPAESDDPDVAPLFAQARHEGATQERNGMSRVGGGREIQFWLLRHGG
jgi:peptidoglycan hydrolase-like protein with peptidoglycan-binding domain